MREESMTMYTSLKNKTIVITGASSGIGSAIAFEAARHHMKLVLTYRSGRNRINKIIHQCEQLGAGPVTAIQLNLLSNTSILNLERRLKRSKIKINFLINNAAICVRKKFVDQTYDEMYDQIRVNLMGTIYLTQRLLRMRRSVTIVNIASILGQRGSPALPIYSVTKWALRGFTESLSASGYRAFSINPDLTATPMTEDTGRPPMDVARVVIELLDGTISSRKIDLNVWEILEQEPRTRGH